VDNSFNCDNTQIEPHQTAHVLLTYAGLYTLGETLMKTSLLLVSFVALTLAGCAGSGTHRSTGEVMDDTSISTRTKAALLNEKWLDGFNIDVEVDRDRVQLNGFVDTQSQVKRAGDIAKSISGVTSVENNLLVTANGSRTTGEYIDDKTLQARVNAALAGDSFVQSMKIDVEVNRGEVSLGGFVDSSAARDAAIAAVRKVAGIRNLVNNMTVR
jgi:osmotically-inducible protein OsmY